MQLIDSDSPKNNQNDATMQPKIPELSFKKLLMYSTKMDKIFMIVGIISAIISGASYPVLSILTGRMINSFQKRGQELIDSASENAIYLTLIGIVCFMLGYLMLATWMITGEKQGRTYRKEYLNAILRQEVAWFDKINTNQLTSKLTTETLSLQGAIGEKFPVLINNISATFFGLLVGLIYGWKLTLVIFGMMPLAGIFMAIFMKLSAAQESAQQEAYADAMAYSEQAITQIKTVKQLCGEDFEHIRYSKCLLRAAQNALKYHIGIGLSFAFIYGIIIWTYALAYWYGSKLIYDQTYNESTGNIYNVADVITVFFSTGLIGYSIGQIGPCLTYYAKGKEAAKNIFQIIERVPQVTDIPNPIDFGDQLGDIKFENVSFSYPNNPDKLILNNLNITIPKGKKVAIVGESGCGKSTIIQLIERFYDCTQGQISIQNNINIKDIDINKYRQKIGMVGQEPVLFATPIKENIKYSNPNVTDDEIVHILKMANAWEFISQMEDQLNTYVGIGGHQLSGGQKQRIAIARALINQPQLLLLDEATSALDRTNEKLIQQTLDKISKGITTLIIAHRLKTIQDADIIYVLDKGSVCEQGTHQQLIQLKGKYYELAKRQICDLIDEKQIPQSMSISKFQSTTDEKDQLISTEKILNKKQSVKYFTKIQYLQRIHPFCNQSKQYLILGTLASICNGSTWPIFTIFYSMILSIMIDLQIGKNDRIDDANKSSLWITLVGICTVFLWAIQTICLNKGGENLTQELRQVTYKKILKMPISYFDDPQNKSAQLNLKLSVDCNRTASLLINWLKVYLQNISSLICGLSIAFYYSWQMALIMAAIQPASYFGQFYAGKFIQGFSDMKVYQNCDSLMMEIVTNIRTVKQLNCEQIIANQYNSIISQAYKQAFKNAIISGLMYGYGQMIRFLITGFEFYIAALFIEHLDFSIQDMLVAIYAVQYSVKSAGETQVLVDNDQMAKQSCCGVFNFLDQEDEYQINKKSAQIKSPIKGMIEIRNLKFKYPTRDQVIFENLNMSIKQGEKVGLVGMSGCGKSTLIQLLLRFYEPQQGEILIDDIDIRQYDLYYLRQQFSIVSQEPVLFQGTIKENIIYNLQNVSEQQIDQILKQTNLTDNNNDNKIDINRQVGNNGNQISGGQKQRIAIARALLRNNQILILDEATSALDSQNEQMIQSQLNQIMVNKTAFIIAHRISTIQDCQIYVINKGTIEEQGTYQQLIDKSGLFFSIYHGIYKILD